MAKKKLTPYRRELLARRKIKAAELREARKQRRAKKKEQQRKRAEVRKAAAAARRQRLLERKQRRQEKRTAKAAPRRNLTVWAQQVKKNAGFKCEVCGRGVEPKLNKDGSQKMSKPNKKTGISSPVFHRLDSHHILPKERYQEYRYDVENGVCLCQQHHKLNKFSAHRNPLWFTLWLYYNRRAKYDWAMARLGTNTATRHEPPMIVRVGDTLNVSQSLTAAVTDKEIAVCET